VEDHTRRSLQAKSRLWPVIKSIVDFDMIIRGFIRINHQSMELLVKEMERDIALSSDGPPGLGKTLEH